MKYPRFFRVATILTCCAFVGTPQLDGQNQQPPTASASQSQPSPPDGEKSKSTTNAAAPSEEVVQVCSKKNPPPCATPPRVVSAPAATFSESVRGKRFDGVSVLSVIVEPNGTTSHIHVLKGLGMGLDERAIEAVKKWKFTPATLHGKPVPVQIAVEVEFHLH